METIGHHTCLKDGGADHVLKNAPFLSIYNPNEENNPFLGEGYYFWDDNLEMAKAWGEMHCDGCYFVVEAPLVIEKSEFFDLVGNRQHMTHLIKLASEFRDNGFDRDNWELSQFIEFLKIIRKKTGYKDIFPFNTIRAVDNSAKKQNKKKFVSSKGAYTNLDPRIIICFISIKNLDLNAKKVKFES